VTELTGLVPEYCNTVAEAVAVFPLLDEDLLLIFQEAE